jgi:hypothetical protein
MENITKKAKKLAWEDSRGKTPLDRFFLSMEHEDRLLDREYKNNDAEPGHLLKLGMTWRVK